MTKTMQSQNHPRVGVGALVPYENKILLGKRLNAHGNDTWAPPGGHLEYGESPQQAAARELEEETGMIAEEIAKGPWTNDFFEDAEKHYITLFMTVTKFRGTPSVKEPHKCLTWKWFAFDALPSPLFLSFQNFLQVYALDELLSLSAAT